MRALGLMSGTSLDGIDIALIETDGRRVTATLTPNGFVEPLGPVGGGSFTDEEKALLRRAVSDAAGMRDRVARPGCLAEAERLVTERHAAAIEDFLKANHLNPAEIDVIGFHGQTVWHRPEAGVTVQLGDGEALARRLGIPVVYDLRAADVAAGGEGAPLVPIFHQALAEASGFPAPLGVVNVGGIANVTLIGADGALLAFDTGPGNGMLNDWMHQHAGQDLDRDGETAARGKPDEAILAWLLAHPFFGRRPPKSLDRNWLSHTLVGSLGLEDGAATLTAFTARSIARAAEWAAEPPRRWIVAGGGAKNPVLMQMLRECLDGEVVTADEIGWSSDHLEAQAFAYLAARSMAGLPLTLPGTTGVKAPTPGGVLARPTADPE